MPTLPDTPRLPADRAARVTTAVDGIECRGYAVVPDFLAAQDVADLRADCLALWRTGRFAAAGIGRGGTRQRDGAVRGDAVLWLDDAPQTAGLRRYLATMETLRLGANGRLMLGLFDLEAHFAVYPPGTCYRRHLDRFRDSDLRTLSCVLYLNDGWQPEAGGQLRLYLGDTPDAPHLDVLPEAGTLACFLSADFPHEVLPARRERLAVTGWFRRRG